VNFAKAKRSFSRTKASTVVVHIHIGIDLAQSEGITVELETIPHLA
jgi:hypothetical protein